MWSKNELVTLWNLAKSNLPNTHLTNNNRDLAAYAGLFCKACKALESSGLAPNNNATWQLLQSKHRICHLYEVPIGDFHHISVGPDFDILSTLRSFPKGTAAGPSGLQIQHLLDVATTPLPTSICSTLRDIVNLLASGKASPSLSRFLAGGNLIGLNKLKDGSAPILVGESLRRLTGKCLCALVKDKASSHIQPIQLGVACSSGVEKIIHCLRKSIEEHVVLKLDMCNAFNLVSRQAVLDECATFSP